MPLREFRVIPVLDVRNGEALHAVGGVRSHYQPVRSRLHPSSDPVQLARAYRDVLGLTDLYLADLDAIAGRPPSVPLYRRLADLGLQLWIDAGLRTFDDLTPLRELDKASLVIGLETVHGPETVGAMLDQFDHDRLILSLDLFDGSPRVDPVAKWPSLDPIRMASSLVNLGVRRLLLLELSRVGTGRGTGTTALAEALREIHPTVELAVGGGISGIGEVVEVRRSGASAVLIGSALHDGRIDRGSLATLTDRQ